MKQIRLSLPDELHSMLEKILNPLAPSRVLVDKIKRINVHIDDSTSEKLTELARQKGTNKNEVIIAILKSFNARVRQLKGISNSDIESLKNNATAVIKTINDNNEFEHKVKLTKATLLAAILCTLAGTSDKIK
jgi:hypothetical protein